MKSERIRIEKAGAYWNLYVDNVLQVEGESWSVVDQVREGLMGRMGGRGGETEEVAESIRQKMGER